ncbi:hypothetical protein [Leucothrix arctica]|uniref:Uncharacterized protein n=1 Tax=Leucothrix arctica TaxID=1481894 RepID=A0A317CFU7_9GAMM|nr:hypothetical protein [Leucothrix arctica]PWQ97425.1 hypothetical protein DKT75_06870 [Leucothrix arctica]
MIYKQLLWTLIISGYASIAFAHNTAPEKHIAPHSISAEKLKLMVITKEELFYIFTECKQFAIDDKIETEFVKDYVEVCSDELTQAFKTAKHELENKNTDIPPLKSRTSSSPRTL